MKLAAFEPPLDLRNRRKRVLLVREIDLDVILRPGLPRAFLRKRMTRAGDDAPAGTGETDHRGVPDATAGPGEQQGAARLICAGGHRGSRVTDKAASCSRCRPVRHAGTRRDHAAGTDDRASTRSPAAPRDSRSRTPAAEPALPRISRYSAQPPSR